MPTRDGQWTNEELVNCASPKWDTAKMHHLDRVASYPEIFGFFDPDQIAAADLPPAHVQAALEDVMGDAARVKRADGRPDLILRLHPWFKRWTVFARQARRTAEGRSEIVWDPVLVCCETANTEARHFEDLRPHDLREKKYSLIWGRVGDYKLPDRRDFEDFKRVCDRQQMKPQERQKLLADRAQAESREFNSQAAAYERDMCDYGFAAYYRDLVRTVGGGQGLPFIPQTSHELLGDGKVNFPMSSGAWNMRVDARRWLRAYEAARAAEGGEHLSDAGLWSLFADFKLEDCDAARALKAKLDEHAARVRILGFDPRTQRTLPVEGPGVPAPLVGGAPAANDVVRTPGRQGQKETA